MGCSTPDPPAFFSPILPAPVDPISRLFFGLVLAPQPAHAASASICSDLFLKMLFWHVLAIWAKN